jgi:ligand-binding sensor domain-containing protein/signal transduction histidine kinase
MLVKMLRLSLWFAYRLSLVLGMTFFAAGCGLKPAPAVPTGNAELVSAVVNTVAGSDRRMLFERISIEQGLSQSVVNSILQDSQGFLWFTTQDGLNRYDGSEFKIFSPEAGNPNSLSDGSLTKLVSDSQGRIWIGTANAGLNRYDPATGQFTRYLPGDGPKDMFPGEVYDILVDPSDESLWVGTSSGLAHLNPESGEFTRFNNIPDNPDSLVVNDVKALAWAPDGKLWVGTSRGLDLLDPATGNFRHFENALNNPNSLGSSWICKLLVDHLGRLWIATHDMGLNRYDPASGKFIHYTVEPGNPKRIQVLDVSALYQDRSKTIWIGSMGGGLCRLDADEQNFTCFRNDPKDPASLGNESVVSIYEDRAGSLWVGTYGGGVNQVNPPYRRFDHLYLDPNDPEHSLGGYGVFAIYQEPDGDVWVGVDGAGLDRVEARTGRVTHYRNDPVDKESLNSNKIHSIYPDRSGALWIGTETGLDYFDPLTGKVKHVPDSSSFQPERISGIGLFALAMDAQGYLWVSTFNGGLNRLDISSGLDSVKVEHYLHEKDNPNSIADDAIYTMYLDHAGNLWIGFIRAGLDRLELSTGKITHYTSDANDPTTLSNPTVLGIREDSRGNIWVGTDAGLNRLDRETGKFRRYLVKDGLPNDVIYRIEEDNQGRLWMSTNKGLSAYDPETETFQNYDVRDGLQSNEFNAGASYRAPDGRLYFGGINGVTAFYPDQIGSNPYLPPVMLTSVTQHGETVPYQPGTELVVRWPNNYFDFDFAALNFIRPEDNQHAYRLEPLDSEWNMIGNKRSGRYTNLPGGTYHLYLKGSNNDGLWNENGAVIRVRVIPPVWGTWWFRGIAAVLLVGSVAGGVGLRTRSIRAHNQELERQVRARTAEIERLYVQTKELAVIEERNRLARDLHDSAKQKAFAALAQMGAANSQMRIEPSRALVSIREAETLVYEVIEELTFLIQEMYPVALKEKGLASVLREYMYEWESRNEIYVDFHIYGERRLPLKLEQSLYRIIQEALANVARHSHAQRVEVVVTYSAGEISICIADNGQGFDLSSRSAGVGLRSMQERISMVGGTLQIESKPGQGTRVSASAPIVGEPDQNPREPVG